MRLQCTKSFSIPFVISFSLFSALIPVLATSRIDSRRSLFLRCKLSRELFTKMCENKKNWLLSAHFSWKHYRTHKVKGVFIFVYTEDRSTQPRECVHCWLYVDWYHTTRRGWLLELLPRSSSISTFDNRAASLEAAFFSKNRISSAVFASPLFLWL